MKKMPYRIAVWIEIWTSRNHWNVSRCRSPVCFLFRLRLCSCVSCTRTSYYYHWLSKYNEMHAPRSFLSLFDSHNHTCASAHRYMCNETSDYNENEKWRCNEKSDKTRQANKVNSMVWNNDDAAAAAHWWWWQQKKMKCGVQELNKMLDFVVNRLLFEVTVSIYTHAHMTEQKTQIALDLNTNNIPSQSRSRCPVIRRTDWKLFTLPSVWNWRSFFLLRGACHSQTDSKFLMPSRCDCLRLDAIADSLVIIRLNGCD